MAITETIEKRRLVVTLGEGQAPASWHWDAVRFLRNDDGSDAAPPQNVTVPCTAQEAAAHISQSMVDLNASIAAKDASIATLTSERDAARAELTAAKAAAQAVAQADSAWEQSVRPLVTQVLA